VFVISNREKLISDKLASKTDTDFARQMRARIDD
jgi:hypothetical protein